MSRALAAALLFLLPAAAAAAWDWHTSLSPHFEVRHEHAFMPPGFLMGLERLHGRLRFDLAQFSPWMSRERLKLYLYRDQASYANGEFKPPPWSNGISMYDKRLVAVYDQQDRKKLLEVVSHETTHLLFESYWGELGRRPPSWLNEGLAMVEEAEARQAEKSDWFRAMAARDPRSFLPLEKVFALSPTGELKRDKTGVEQWYVQSYSLVYFLLRGHSRLQFKSFCGKLRDGVPVEQALWLSYRYRTIPALEKAWRAWLTGPEVRRALSAR